MRMQKESAKKPLIVSMGFNGYQWAYRRNIDTHRAYARRHGYDCVFVKKPAFTRLLMECAWLKLPLMLAALRSGRPWVFYLDSDIEVKQETPAIETLFCDGKTLYMANGLSGRLNSGVIIARNDPAVTALLERIVDNALMIVPKEDRVGWGENGHVIHFAKNFAGLQLIDSVWNNNSDPKMDDYLRHYSAGPMRRHYQFTWAEKACLKIGKVYIKRMKAIFGTKRFNGDFFANLRSLTDTALRHYPELGSVRPRSWSRGKRSFAH